MTTYLINRYGKVEGSSTHRRYVAVTLRTGVLRSLASTSDAPHFRVVWGWVAFENREDDPAFPTLESPLPYADLQLGR
jgi:hypothetical protein